MKRSLIALLLVLVGAAEVWAQAAPTPAAPAPADAAAAPGAAPLPGVQSEPPVAQSGQAPQPFPASAAAGPEPEPDPKPDPDPQPEPDAENEADAETERGFRLEALLGVGAGSVAFARPARLGTVQELSEAPFAALDAALRLRLRADQAARLELQSAFRYRSSLGLTLEGTPAFALPSEQDARMQRIELSALALYRFSAARSAPALGAELGFALRSLVPEVTGVVFPKYALAGPLLRVLLNVELLPGLTLRAAPELSFVALVDGSIREDGVGAQGYGLGGELTLRARLLPWLAAELSARQAEVRVPHTGAGADFEETERFATLGLAGEL